MTAGGVSPLPADQPDIVDRKAEHIRINLEEDVAAKGVTTGFERYRFAAPRAPRDRSRVGDAGDRLPGTPARRPPPLLLHDRRHDPCAPDQPHPGGGGAAPPGGHGAGLVPGAPGAPRGAPHLRRPRPLPRRAPAGQPGSGPAQSRGGDRRLPADRRAAGGRRAGSPPQPPPGGPPAGGGHPVRRSHLPHRGALLAHSGSR